MFALSILTVGQVVEFIDQSAHLSAIAPGELGFKFHRYYSTEGYMQNRLHSYDCTLFDRENTNTYYNINSESDEEDGGNGNENAVVQLRSVYRFRPSSMLSDNEATTVERVLEHLAQSRFRDASKLLQSPSVSSNVQEALYDKVHNVWLAYYNRCSPVPPSFANEIDLLFVSKCSFTPLRWMHVDRLLDQVSAEDQSEDRDTFVQACVELVNYLYPEAAFGGDDSDHHWQRLLAAHCWKQPQPWRCANAIVDKSFSGFSFNYADVRDVLVPYTLERFDQASEHAEPIEDYTSATPYCEPLANLVYSSEIDEEDNDWLRWCNAGASTKEKGVIEPCPIQPPTSKVPRHLPVPEASPIQPIETENDVHEWIKWCADANFAADVENQCPIDLPVTEWETYCPNADYNDYQHWNHLAMADTGAGEGVKESEEIPRLATPVPDDETEPPNTVPEATMQTAEVQYFEMPKPLVVQEYDVLHRVCAFTIVQRAAGFYAEPGEYQDTLGRSLVECLTTALQYGDSAYMLDSNTSPIVLSSWTETLLWPRDFTEEDMKLLCEHLQKYSYGMLRISNCLEFVGERLTLQVEFVYRPSAFFVKGNLQ